jgi:hypothetical protein
MRNLSNGQFAITAEDQIRKRGLMNPDRGFVGNGFWWGLYPSQVASQSGYGGYMTASQPQAVNQDSGETASAADGAGVSAVGGMASN